MLDTKLPAGPGREAHPSTQAVATSTGASTVQTPGRVQTRTSVPPPGAGLSRPNTTMGTLAPSARKCG
jgi:hypothetical protein